MKKEKNQKPPTLQSWRKYIWNGDIPIPVFNATLVEDGKRFLISPLKFIDVSLSQISTDNPSQLSSESTALDFYTLFQIPKPEQTCNGQKKHNTDKIYDLKISTAARLSASFPYVSPLARNSPDNCIKINKYDKTFNYHVADGGYFDNAGIHTIIEWLTKEKNCKPFVEVLRDKLNVTRILILQINAFPKPTLKDQKGSLGWITEFIGPISTLNQVRDSTQIARNQQEVKLFKKAWEKEGNLEIEEFTIYFPEIDSYKPPLSWNLSNAQKENIKNAWEVVKQDQDSDFHRLKNIWDKWENNGIKTSNRRKDKPLVEETFYFDFDSAEIKNLSKIESFWSNMKGKKGTLIVKGHTDSSGLKEYNQELSEKRAEQVVKILRELALDEQYQVKIQGLGENFPLKSNTTEENKAFNRRAVVKIEFIPNTSESDEIVCDEDDSD